MKWYKIIFEPFDELLGKHYLGYYNNKFILVSHSAALLFSENALKNDIELKSFLKDKKYRLIKPKKIYDVMKYRY